MPIQSSQFGSLTQSAQLQKLKNAKIALWIAGVLQIAFHLFAFFNMENEYQTALEQTVKEHGGKVENLQYLDEADKEEIAREKAEFLSRARLVYGSAVGVGAALIGCALLVNKKPVVATILGLVLFIGFHIVLTRIDIDNLRRGIILKIFVIVSLIGGMKAAYAYERDRRQQAV